MGNFICYICYRRDYHSRFGFDMVGFGGTYYGSVVTVYKFNTDTACHILYTFITLYHILQKNLQRLYEGEGEP